MTRYDYKLSSFNFVDSEGKSRTFMFCLTLSETAENFKSLLDEYSTAFGCLIPCVVVTDGDEAMSAAISSLKHFEFINHLLCVYHLFDMNIKQQVQYVVNSHESESGWAKFREGLSECKDAVTEEEFNRLWDQLLKEWFRNETTHKQCEEYMKIMCCLESTNGRLAFFHRHLRLATAQRNDRNHVILL